MTFTINAENNITAHATLKQAQAVEGAECFRNEAGLAKLATHWPIVRLVEIWNNLPGVSPVKKFKDRPTGVARIWKAIQPATGEAVHKEAPAAIESIESAVKAVPNAALTTTQDGAQGRDVAAEAAPGANETTQPGDASKAKRSRPGSKTAQVLDLMKREGGVTAKEIMALTGWQAHSVRGFISGALGKKMGLTVDSTKGENGERTYSILN